MLLLPLLIGQITCNGSPGLSAAFLVGMGPSYPIYNTWFLNYGSGLFQLKYFNSDSATTVSEILEGASSLFLSSCPSFALSFVGFFPLPVKDPRPDMRLSALARRRSRLCDPEPGLDLDPPGFAARRQAHPELRLRGRAWI
jgi:hypothetical protein